MIIKNGILVDPSQGLEEPGTLYLQNDRVSRIVPGEYTPAPEDEREEILDASGKYVMPGLIDLHVHFRDPGQTYKEDIATGAAAAAAGGVTTVCAMPNTNPTVDSVETLRYIQEKAEKEAVIRVEQLSAMKPVKGRAILDLYRAERQPKPREAAEDAPKREPEVLPLVLKREDD